MVKGPAQGQDVGGRAEEEQLCNTRRLQTPGTQAASPEGGLSRGARPSRPRPRPRPRSRTPYLTLSTRWPGRSQATELALTHSWRQLPQRSRGPSRQRRSQRRQPGPTPQEGRSSREAGPACDWVGPACGGAGPSCDRAGRGFRSSASESVLLSRAVCRESGMEGVRFLARSDSNYPDLRVD